MRIFITELQQSVEIDESTYASVKGVMPFLAKMLTPIKDVKFQLQLNANYLVNNFEDYAIFFRLYSASSIVLGGLFALSENIFRLHHADARDYENLSTEELVKTEIFQDFCKTESYKEKLDEVALVNDVDNLDEAVKEVLRLSGVLSKAILNSSIYNNVVSTFALKTEHIRAALTPNLISDRKAERCLNIYIKQSQRRALIFFNGSEREYEMLDNWLSTEELKLPINEDDSAWIVESEQDLVAWFNGLRSRLESECSYQTLMNYVDTFDDTEKDKYKRNIQNKLTALSKMSAENILEIRLRVIGFLNAILNSRKGEQEKKFESFTIAQLASSFSNENDYYLLNLYS